MTSGTAMCHSILQGEGTLINNGIETLKYK